MYETDGGGGDGVSVTWLSIAYILMDMYSAE
jgi:hypothetical protein